MSRRFVHDGDPIAALATRLVVMSSVESTLRLLLADRDHQRLQALCRQHEVDLLVLFGSARRAPGTASDVDVAFSFRHGVDGDELAFVNTLGARYGDALDVMALDRAGSLARYQALGGGEVLVETTEEKFASMQMAAFGEFVDTQRFRDRILERLAT